MIYLKTLFIALVFFVLSFLHFRFIHLDKLIEISGALIRPSGYLLHYGSIKKTDVGIQLFLSLTSGLILIGPFLFLSLRFLHRPYIGIVISFILFFYLYLLSVAEFLFLQKTGTWTHLDSLLVGLLGFK
jgi:hypothetical protein